MKRTLKIEIDNVRDHACSDGKGKFCPWMRTKHFGQQFYCGLFADDTGEIIELRDQKGAASGEGTLQRLPQCLKAEKVGGGTKDDSKARCEELQAELELSKMVRDTHTEERVTELHLEVLRLKAKLAESGNEEDDSGCCCMAGEGSLCPEHAPRYGDTKKVKSTRKRG